MQTQHNNATSSLKTVKKQYKNAEMTTVQISKIL